MTTYWKEKPAYNKRFCAIWARSWNNHRPYISKLHIRRTEFCWSLVITMNILL